MYFRFVKKFILILFFVYGLMNQVSARFIPASVYENSYRYSFVAAEGNLFRHILTLSRVKESHDMEIVEHIEIFTDKNHAGKTFIESNSTITYLKTRYRVPGSGLNGRVFQTRIIRLILFPFHDFF